MRNYKKSKIILNVEAHKKNLDKIFKEKLQAEDL